MKVCVEEFTELLRAGVPLYLSDNDVVYILRREVDSANFEQEILYGILNYREEDKGPSSRLLNDHLVALRAGLFKSFIDLMKATELQGNPEVSLEVFIMPPEHFLSSQRKIIYVSDVFFCSEYCPDDECRYVTNPAEIVLEKQKYRTWIDSQEGGIWFTEQELSISKDSV